MKKTAYFETIYRKSESTGRVIIDVALEDYLEFFHEWDNAVFRKRDVRTELADFLDQCSEDIPLKEKLQIVFCVNATEACVEKEEQIRISYRNHYEFHNRLEQRKTRRIIKFSAILLFTSLVLLTVYSLLSDFEPTRTLTKVLLESLLIGGWVFAWEAVHLLFLDILEPFRRRREIRRFLEAEISFKYLTE